MAGIHGNENVGTWTFTELAEYIQTHYKEFKQLLNTRMLIIVPFINPQGFKNQRRGEQHCSASATPSQCMNQEELDPNRDFPYNTSDCFNTSTGRFTDQLFRSHLIISTFIFHGGTTVLSYPWGN